MTQPALSLLLPTKQQDREAIDALQEMAPLSGTRSQVDQVLAERVGRALVAMGYSPLRAIEVSVSDRIVRLRGWVPSYYLKQLAQGSVLAVPGVHELCNELEVAHPSAIPES